MTSLGEGEVEVIEAWEGGRKVGFGRWLLVGRWRVSEGGFRDGCDGGCSW